MRPPHSIAGFSAASPPTIERRIVPFAALSGLAALIAAVRHYTGLGTAATMAAATILAGATHALDSPLPVIGAIVGILGANATFLYTATRIYRSNNDELRDQLTLDGQRIDRLERELRTAEINAAGQRELKHQAQQRVAELEGKLAERPDLNVVIEALKAGRVEMIEAMRELWTAQKDAST